jgi:glycine/D-amino acid oxidase-like deaminating enzyme
MKTLVLGGGVVGVTTAYFLARAGHEVTLLEEDEIAIDPFNLQPGEEAIIAARLREELTRR